MNNETRDAIELTSRHFDWGATDNLDPAYPATALASILGWKAEETRLDPDSEVVRGVRLTKAFAGSQAAAIFVDSFNEEAELNLDLAANYAYQSSIHWGVSATSTGLTIFNSHWVKSDGWFTFPTIEWTTLPNHLETLDKLTPQAVTSGELERYAASRGGRQADSVSRG